MLLKTVIHKIYNIISNLKFTVKLILRRKRFYNYSKAMNILYRYRVRIMKKAYNKILEKEAGYFSKRAVDSRRPKSSSLYRPYQDLE